MLNVIKTSPTLLSVFKDQSFIWWNKPDIIKLIEAIVGNILERTLVYIIYQSKLRCLYKV